MHRIRVPSDISILEFMNILCGGGGGRGWVKSMELAARPDPTPLHFPAVKFIDVLSMQLLCLVYRTVQVEVKENLTVERLPLRCMIFPTWGWSSTSLLVKIVALTRHWANSFSGAI
jgi:hypothetical protein